MNRSSSEFYSIPSVLAFFKISNIPDWFILSELTHGILLILVYYCVSNKTRINCYCYSGVFRAQSHHCYFSEFKAISGRNLGLKVFPSTNEGGALMDETTKQQQMVVDMMTEGYLSSFRQIEKVLGKVSSKFGVGWSGLSILNQLATNQSANVSDLAEKNHVTKGAISIQISELMKAKLIEMDEDPNDRRRHIVKLTFKGQKVADHEVAQAKDMASQVLNNMGEAEMMRLHTDFAAFAHLLEDTKLE